MEGALGNLDPAHDLEILPIGRKVSVGPKESAIKLYISGKHRLNLVVRYSLSLSTNKRYLAVENSEFKVFPVDDDATARFGPVIAFDYRREPTSREVPSAHLNIDSNNDSVLFMLAGAGHSRRIRSRREKARKQVAKDPTVTSEHGSERDIHIPVGGARCRPCLEDVLEMLIVEFGVDHSSRNWREILARGRRKWREHQLAAAVNDNPEGAAHYLRELGFTLEWAQDGVPPAPNHTKLGRF